MAHTTFFKSQLETRSASKAKRTAATVKARRDVYALVDVRDEGRCRFCGVKTIANGGLSLKAREHHHLKGRRGRNAERTGNVVTLCRAHHEDKHVRGVLQVSGNADGRLSFKCDGEGYYSDPPMNGVTTIYLLVDK